MPSAWSKILRAVFGPVRPISKGRIVFVRPAVEFLEDRCTPATITVTSTNDDTDLTAIQGAVTLREAVESINEGRNINADVTAAGQYGINDTIVFGLQMGPHVAIQLKDEIDITEKLTIDGFADDAENARPNSGGLGDGINAMMRVEISRS